MLTPPRASLSATRASAPGLLLSRLANATSSMKRTRAFRSARLASVGLLTTMRILPRPAASAAESERMLTLGIGRALADAKVNILSLSAAEAAGRGKIRMVVNKPTLAKRALRKARVRFIEEVAFAKRL